LRDCKWIHKFKTVADIDAGGHCLKAELFQIYAVVVETIFEDYKTSSSVIYIFPGKNDLLFVHFMFYVPCKNFSLIGRPHHCRCRAAKLRPMLGNSGRLSRPPLLQHRVLVFRSHSPEGPPHLVASCNTQGDVEGLF
jgi:hypothetical protein